MFLILMSGCSSIPYRIEDVRVKETYTIQRGQYYTLIGCKIYVRNIFTSYIGDTEDKWKESISGTVICDRPESTEFPVYLPFESIREDNTFRRQFERGRTNLD